MSTRLPAIELPRQKTLTTASLPASQPPNTLGMHVAQMSRDGIVWVWPVQAMEVDLIVVW